MSDQGIKSTNQKIQLTRDKRDQTQRRPGTRRRGRAVKTWTRSRFRGRTGVAAPVLWARSCPPGPLSLGVYKYPLGVQQRGYPEFRSCCYLVLEVVVVVVFFFF